MCKLHPEDENARKQVEEFCKHVFDLRVVHDIIKELFEDEQAQSLMERTAHWFFIDLSKIVGNYLRLEMTKLTDPASSRTPAGNVENFIISNMLDSIQWPVEVLKELKRLSQPVLKVGEYNRLARNKILAHNDKETILLGKTLGSFPEGEDDRATGALREMCDCMHQASFGESCGDISFAHNSDVRALKLALQRALAFDKVLSRNESAEFRTLMLECLTDIKKGDV
ncbi:MAG: hypothetical protein JSW27_07690 [Phycisphaerales bacterium]|nr:MAG: hypothetical protein JSW27_07690 [Phycisphaerales bacterium]